MTVERAVSIRHGNTCARIRILRYRDLSKGYYASLQEQYDDAMFDFSTADYDTRDCEAEGDSGGGPESF